MTGERLAWFRVASHLKLTIGELRERITATEFLGWLQFLDWEERRETKQDYYLAQIAAETRRGNVKHPNRIKVKDLLLKFENGKEGNCERSKSIWLNAVGLKPAKK